MRTPGVRVPAEPGPRYEIIKSYPPRGPLHQYRVRTATAFRCLRCGQAKTSKLVTVLDDDWSHLLCNGCYGWLLSVYTVKAGTSSIDTKAEALAEHLLTLIPAEAARQAAELFAVQDERMARLRPRSLRLLVTAEYVARQLAHTTSLDWSAAVIGLCKAVEVEFTAQVLDPLRASGQDVDLRADCADPALGRVARYCAGRQATAPELGAMRRLLLVASQRPSAGGLLAVFRGLLRAWPNSDWLVDPDGAPAGLEQLAKQFRNPAAHTSELTTDDYAEGHALVLGGEGLLWRLLHATTPRR
jgi:hypothetical protein